MGRRDFRIRRGVSCASADREQPGCLVLDVTMPGLDGLELQRRLAEEGRRCRSCSSPVTATSRCRCRRSKPAPRISSPSRSNSEALLAPCVRRSNRTAPPARPAPRCDVRASPCDADLARARSARGGGEGKAQQADRRRPRHRRADRQVPSRPDHGANAGTHGRRADAHCGKARNRVQRPPRGRPMPKPGETQTPLY